MKRSSGMLMLILVALLVILPVSAFGLDPDNGTCVLDLETKTIGREEVAEIGEIVTAIAVDPKPMVSDLILVEYIGMPNNDFVSYDEGGTPVIPGGLSGIPM